jgi:hypothetical protein
MIRIFQYRRFLTKKKAANSYKIASHKVLSTICLFILIFYLMRPALPFLEYLLLKDYISKNLCIQKDIPGNCCEGICYLEEQLKKATEPMDANRDTNKEIQDNKFNDHFLAEAKVNKPVEEELLQKKYYSESTSESVLAPVLVPPES